MILSLDISTSCTGWALWSMDGVLVDSGAIETKTSTKKDKARFPDHFAKMDYVIRELVKICALKEEDVKFIAAEAALKKFTAGKTTANTMAALIAFNFCLVYSLTRQLQQDVRPKEIMIDVKTARKNLGIIIPKGAKDKKKYVIEKIKPMYPNLDWPLKSTGKFKDWVGDRADAIVIGKFALKLLSAKKP